LIFRFSQAKQPLCENQIFRGNMTHPLVITQLSTPLVVRHLKQGGLGKIQSLAMDEVTGQTLYALIRTDVADDSESALHPVPWNALTFNAEFNGYTAPMTKHLLATAPDLDIDSTSARTVCRHYGLSLSGHARC
jgi:hypothetical protein